MSNDLAFWLSQLIQLLESEPLTAPHKVPPSADELERLEMWRLRSLEECDPDRAPHAPGDLTPSERRAAAIRQYHHLTTQPPRIEWQINPNLTHAIRQVAQLSGQWFGLSPVGLRMLRHGETGHPAMWYIAEKVEAYDYARSANGESGWVECATDEWETAEVVRIDLWSPIRDRSRSVYPKNEECTAAVVQVLRETLSATEQLPATDNGTVPPNGDSEKKKKSRKKRGNGQVGKLFDAFCIWIGGQHMLAGCDIADIARRMTDRFGEQVSPSSLACSKAFKEFLRIHPRTSDPVHRNLELEQLIDEQRKEAAADGSRRGRRVKM